MKYIANYKLSAFVKRTEGLIIGNFVSTLIFIVFPCVFEFFVDGSVNMDLFWDFGIYLVVINFVTFLIFLQRGKTLNKTIKTLTIDDGNLLLETFSFRVLKFWTIKKKTENIKSSELVFFKDKYPLNDKNYILDSSCFMIKINEKTFYLLDYFFANELKNLFVKS